MRIGTDLSGRIFGKLTVVRRTSDRSKNGDVFWLCLCECGKETKITTANLHRRSNPSCGCGLMESQINFAEKNRNNLTGKRFGNLTVVRRVPGHTTNQRSLWECKCDCGNVVIVSSGYLLKTDFVQSCGCLNGHKFNRKQMYEQLTGIPVPPGYFVIFLDGDATNCDKSNMYHISNAVRQRMIRRGWFYSDAERTLAAIKICELEMAIKNKEKSL